MKKKLLTFSMLLFVIVEVSAQGSNEKIFHALGFSAYSDFASSPISSKTYTDTNFNTATGDFTHTSYNHAVGFSFVSFMYRIRYNIHEISDNFSISLNGTPALGLTASNAGALSFNLPLMVGIEYGAGSTYNSTSNVGTFFSAGIEFTKMPVIVSSNGKETDYSPAVKSSWVEPVFSTGIRYWNKKNKLREINIKYGFGSKSTDPLATTSSSSGSSSGIFNETSGTGRAMTLRLSWLVFLNY